MAQPTPKQIEDIIFSQQRMDKVIDMADSLVFEDQLVEGTRYKYVFTSHLDGMEE